MRSRSPADGVAVGFALVLPGPDAVPGLNLLRTGLVATRNVLLLAATRRAAVWSRRPICTTIRTTSEFPHLGAPQEISGLVSLAADEMAAGVSGWFHESRSQTRQGAG